MEFTMNRDSPSIRRLEYRISQLEKAMKIAKKTTRIHQNNKKMIKLNEELNHAVYQHNKFNIFEVLEKELSREYEKTIDSQFAMFTHIDDVIR